MQQIHTACSGCGNTLAVDSQHAGKQARCPACGQIYTVPLQSTALGLADAMRPWLDQRISQDPLIPLNIQVQSVVDDTYWLRTKDGAEYGPVDQAALGRWFQEGRIGIGCAIRSSRDNAWSDAAQFLPQLAQAKMQGTGFNSPVNPYAASVAMPTGQAFQNGPAHANAPYQPTLGQSVYTKSDKGVVVLIMGLCAWGGCLFYGLGFVFAIVAVVMGSIGLSDIRAGLANPKDKTLVQLGFWLGLSNLLLYALVIGLLAVWIVLVAFGFAQPV